MKRRLQARDASAVDGARADQLAHQPREFVRAYTITDVCARLTMPRRTFFHLRRTHQLPFLEELQPRLGRCVRYRAALVDRYVANQWNRRA